MIFFVHNKFKIITFLSILLISAFNVFSITVNLRVNPDSAKIDGVRYQTLNDCIGYASSSHSVDTIFFTSAQDTFDMTANPVNFENYGPHYFISNQTDPDKFPVIHHESNNYYMFFQANDVHFSNIIFEGTSTETPFRNGQSTKTMSFNKCIIRNHIKNFILFEPPNTGTVGTRVLFNNCLFENNTDTLLLFSLYNPVKFPIKFINCTFDKCNIAIIFTGSNKDISSMYDSMAIKNCIFTDVTVPVSNLIKSKITNSLFNSASDVNYGAGCIFSTDSLYIKPTGRIIPSDWKIRLRSPAFNKIDSINSLSIDIAGQSRSGPKADMGCWEFQNHTPTDITLSSSSFAENGVLSAIIGNFSTVDTDVGDTFTYAFISGTGSTDNSLFSISGNKLSAITIANFEVKPSYSIRVRSTDASAGFVEKNFTISVTDTGDAPTNITLSDTLLFHKSPVGTLIGKLSAADPDASETFVFSLASGGTNNSFFSISHDSLKTADTVAAATPSILSILVKATDKYGLTFQKTFNIKVVKLGAISVQPKDTSVLVGKPASFSITASGELLTYQWAKNNVAISGATTSILNIASASMTDSAALYKCNVTNPAGTISSSTARLLVSRPATITVEPLSDTISEGDSIQFSITAVGSGTLSYQWYKNSTLITSGNLSSFKITNATIAADSGTLYKCIVSNIYGSDTSIVAALHVIASKPAITTEPAAITVPDLTNAIFRCKATGSGTLQYVWLSTKSTDTLSRTDTLLIANVLKARDSGTSYYCIVSNAAGSDTSTIVQLHVGNVLPIITVQPDTQEIFENSTALFTIQSTGSSPLHYAWYKKSIPPAADSLTGTDNDTLLLTNVSLIANGSYYYCGVSNSAGNAVSRSVILRVLNALKAPSIINQPPKLLTKYSGDSLRLSVIASGNPLPVFQWVKNDTVLTGKTDSILVISNLSMINNNSKIYCIVSNSLDTVSSDTTVLKIESRPGAAFGCTPITGAAPLTVSFTDSSTGTIISRLWYFGDNTTSPEINPVHKYNTPGEYTVKLIVLGTGGVDSITRTNVIYVYNEGSNPVQVTGKFLNPSSIILTYTNLSNIDVTIPPPVADSLVVWYKKDSIPLSLTTATRVISYPVSLFAGLTAYTDTILLPPNDSYYGIMTGIVYNKKDISTVVSSNGCLVLMRDTASSDNQIIITGKYVKADSGSVQLSNLSSIDTSRVDSIGVWYGRDTSLIDFTKVPTTWFSSRLLRGQPSGQYSFAISNPLFLDTGTVWCAVVCKSFNGKLSVKKLSSFKTSGALSNPIILSATAVSPGSVLLKWNLITDTSFSRIRLWKGLLDIPSGTTVSTSQHDSVRVLISDTSYLFQGLTANTIYYFGAQAFVKDGYWTDITIQSKSSVMTPAPTDSFANRIQLRNIRFDSASNKIIVSWKIDTISQDTLYAGISYSLNGTQTGTSLQYVIINQSLPYDSTEVNIKPPFLFDTTYNIALWMSKNSTGYWAKPTTVSSGTVKTLPFNHQAVSFFDKNNLTAYAANNTIKLWTDNVSFPLTTDTVKINKASYNGYIVVNPGFYFTKKENTLPFYIGLSYSALPPKYNKSQLKLYRGYADGTVNVDYTSIVDTLNKFVYVKTDNLIQTFMLMIDTVRPAVSITGDTASAIKVSDLQEKFTISDNTNNVKWIYRYSRGDGGNAKVDSGYYAKSEKEKIVTILQTAFVINSDNGVRINLTITDGAFTESFNLSRRVFRTSSDVSTLTPGKWFPLSVTAKLINSPAESILVKINPDSLYDNRYVRLFQWNPKKPNDFDSGWVEYSPDKSSQFNFTPGKITWIKTLDYAKSIDFGEGRTLSLKDTLRVSLPPFSYTDVALPFIFDMNLSDILSSTPNSDSLRFYKWVKNTTNDYTSSLIYSQSFPSAEFKNKNIKLVYENGGGMTIFNPRADTLKLSFPPTPYTGIGLTKSIDNSKSWSVKISCLTGDGTSLQDLHYGYSNGIKERYYPVSPSFIQNKIALFERINRSMNGLYQTGNIMNGGIAKEIALVNNSDSTVRFKLHADNSGDFPSDFNTVFYNPLTSEFENNGTATITPHSTEYRWAITSNSSYLKNYFSKVMTLTYALGTLYPNPCRSLLNIPYTIPLGSSDIIVFEMFDQLGRMVWKKEVVASQAGTHHMIWNGKGNSGMPISSGCYLLRLTSKNDRKVITSRFQSRFTYLP